MTEFVIKPKKKIKIKDISVGSIFMDDTDRFMKTAVEIGGMTVCIDLKTGRGERIKHDFCPELVAKDFKFNVSNYCKETDIGRLNEGDIVTFEKIDGVYMAISYLYRDRFKNFFMNIENAEMRNPDDIVDTYGSYAITVRKRDITFLLNI